MKSPAVFAASFQKTLTAPAGGDSRFEFGHDRRNNTTLVLEEERQPDGLR